MIEALLFAVAEPLDEETLAAYLKDQAGKACVWAIKRTLLPAVSPAHENPVEERRRKRRSSKRPA